MGKTKKNKDRQLHRYNPLDQHILENSIVKESHKIRRKERDVKQDRQEDLEEESGFSYSSGEIKTEDDASSLSSSSAREKESENLNEDENGNVSEKFMEEDFQGCENLSYIEETLTENKTEIFRYFAGFGIDEKKFNLFKQLAPELEEFSSGKLPELFKIIPNYIIWEDILHLTEPYKWSALTVYYATRVFFSKLNDGMLPRFCNLILLPRVRDDIAKYKKLDINIIKALGKALQEPAPFFKGIILPLCEAQDSTVREAKIISSIMEKCSISVLHSSTALLTIAEMDYSEVNSVFMKVLIEKNYALVCRVINSIVNHFLRFMTNSSECPLSWHECLLSFVKIYKIDFSDEQRINLLKLLAVQSHEEITPKIQKELESKLDLQEVMPYLLKM